MHLAIFDVDGTLIESDAADNSCFLAAFEDTHGIREINTDWSSYRYSTDTGVASEILERHFGEVSSEHLNSVRARFLASLDGHIAKWPIRPVPGATTFMKYLARKPDWRIAIATGSWRKSAEIKLKKAGFDLGDIVLTSSNETLSRADIIRDAMRRSSEGVEPPPRTCGLRGRCHLGCPSSCETGFAVCRSRFSRKGVETPGSGCDGVCR